MYDDFKVANYSKALLSPEMYARHLSRLFSGDVVDGLNVTPGTGLQVVLQPGNSFVRYGSSAVASARLVSLVNTFALTIGTPDVSNPRHDLVVVYVDTSVSLPGGVPTSANLDGKGVAKAVVVKGSPSSSPSDPNTTAIQAAIGSSAYSYTIVARVRVNPGVSVIATNLITDLRIQAGVPKSNINFDSGIWGEEIGRATSASATASLTVNVPVRKYVQILASGLMTPGAPTDGIVRIRINGRTGTSDYSRIITLARGTTVTAINSASSGFPVSTNPQSTFQFNLLKSQNTGWLHFTGSASSSLEAREGMHICAFGGDVTSVTLLCDNGAFMTGVELVVLGHN